jgi:hypothetical protein
MHLQLISIPTIVSKVPRRFTGIYTIEGVHYIVGIVISLVSGMHFELCAVDFDFAF